MEYIFTNLPQYIRQISRTAFSNSVVQSGSVLLFSEDGTTLTAKLPDGSFVTVGGGSGTDVSDTTATAADVLSGKDFYLANGTKTTGSIQTVTASASGNVVTVPAGYIASQQTITIGTAKAAATYTPGTTDQTITAGQYLTGDQTIKGDANLLAANIVQGVTIFGVTGTASGNATNFYLCASVSSGTWTGYKAIQDQVTGAWGYASTVTSNLTYSEVTPVIGKVYADGALIEANLWSGIPTSGLVFHASLAASSATAETGQTLTEVDGSPTYATVQGIPCAEFDGYCYLRFADTGFPYPNGFSVSLWVKGNVQDQQRCCVSWGTNEANESFGIMLNPNGTMKTVGAKNANNEWTSDQGAISTSGWNHICVVNRGTSEDIYINGTKVGTFSWTRAVVLGSYGYIGAMTDLDWLLIGYLAGVRIYSRQLTDSEIAALAAEFTPTPGA